MTPEALESAGAGVVLRRGLSESPRLRRGLGITLAIALGAAVGRVSVPLLIQQTIDRGILADDGFDGRFVILACAVASLVAALTWLAQATTLSRLVSTSEAALSELRVRAFAHVHRLSVADHVERAAGAMVTRVTSDIDALARFLEWGGLVWILNSGIIVLTLVVMVVYSWQLTLAVLAVFILLPLLFRFIQRRQLDAHDRLRGHVAEQGAAFSEELGGVATIRAHALSDRSRTRLLGSVRAVERSRLRANRYMALSLPLTELVGTAALAAIVSVAAWRGEAWGLQLGEVVAFLFLVNLLLAPIAEMSEVLDQTQSALAGWRKVLMLLATPIEIVDPVAGRALPGGPLAVSCRGLGFRYRTGAQVLHDIDLELAPGTDVAIVGETGSGKSTFAKLLVRLADPSEGELYIGGEVLAEVAPAERRRAIRMVPQDGFLFATTVRANIGFGREGSTDADVDAAVDALGLGWWVDRLPDGLDTELGEHGGRLSVGERQLVALLRAQLADPGLLILDEATSSVDPETERALAAALAHLARGRTTISIAHRLATAEQADLVLVFDQGRIVERGAHAELVRAGGVYAQLHRSWLGAVGAT